MQTETRNIRVVLGQAYRNYARIMHAQMRRNSQTMRESEIVKKIVKTWDALSANQKIGWKNNEMKETIPLTPLKLEEGYGRKEKVNNSNNKSTDEKMKSDQKMSNQKLEKQEEMIKEKMMNQNSTEMMNSKSKGIAKKNKKLNKLGQYMSFFKNYYPKVMMEHPNWTPNQATVIIKLLWRKRKTQLKKISTAKVARKQKRISGRMAFRKSMNVSKQQMLSLWKRLPIETKRIWIEKGKHSTESSPLINKTSMIKLSSVNEMTINMPTQSTAFSFMNLKM